MKLDLNMLSSQLRQTEACEPQFDEEVNPYLLNTVVPRLAQGGLTLGQIDLDEFDEEDPFTILRYFEWENSLSHELYRLNGLLCQLPPACTRARTFL